MTKRIEWPVLVSDPTHDYCAYGLHIRSATPIPFDPPGESGKTEPDVTVCFSTIPATLPEVPATSPAPLRQARPGAFLMHMRDVARYLVTGDRDVLAEPHGGDADGVAAFFLSLPFTTLHATAVATEAGAVLLGRSGIGKSSLAAVIVERDYPLLADDVVLNAVRRALALLAFSRQRLWAHTLDEMR